MNTQTTSDSLIIEQIIKQVKNAWAGQNKVVTEFFNKYEDDAYLNEVAPGRNRAIYLLGHLIAANDGMLPMFSLRDRLFPGYEAMFLSNADKTVDEIPSLAELKQNWNILNTTLADYFNKMEAQEWLERHMRVSPEDFAIDPLRNKLNVLIGRTNHQSYHSGQLTFLPQEALVG